MKKLLSISIIYLVIPELRPAAGARSGGGGGGGREGWTVEATRVAALQDDAPEAQKSGAAVCT